MNENQPPQKPLNTINHRRFILYLILAFLAGSLCTGLLITGQRFTSPGKLDQRYFSQHRGATEIVRRLEAELERERDINHQLREHNTRAREITEGLADTSLRNVRDLQTAIVLISEIRAKVKVLAEVYDDWATGGGDR
jgi:hypothetical protein